MGLRFRRRVRILPGVYLNFSRSGISASTGVRGASMTFGRTGVYANLGLPGSGLSYRSRIDRADQRARKSARRGAPGAFTDQASGEHQIQLRIDAEGRLTLFSAEGDPIPDSEFRKLRRRTPGPFRDAMAEHVATQESLLSDLLDLHTQTPHPKTREHPTARPFLLPEPARPAPLQSSLLTWLLPWTRRRFEARKQQSMERFKANHARWQTARDRHNKAEKTRIETLMQGLASADPSVMEDALARRLASLEWPRETEVSFELSAQEAHAALDVDLPEQADLPTVEYRLPKRQWRILQKEFSNTERQAHYARHVHGVVFRLLGEVFACLPSVSEVRVAGYTQRLDKATGAEQDDYVLAVTAKRADWEKIDFNNLNAIDPIRALERFSLRREMSARGELAGIEAPHWTR